MSEAREHRSGGRDKGLYIDNRGARDEEGKGMDNKRERWGRREEEKAE